MFFVHMPGRVNAFVSTAQKFGSDRITFQIYAELALKMHNTGKPFTTGWMAHNSEIVIGKGIIFDSIRISKAMSDQGLFFMADTSLSSGGINFIIII